MTVTCSADNKRVLVGYTNDGTTPSIFGGVFDAGDLTARRTATADVFVRNDGFGLRPYAVCALDRQLLQNASAPASSPKWIKIVYPNPLCGSYGGNWYTTDCPLDGNNGTLADNTRNGCNSSVGILPQRDSAGNPLPIGTITSSIISECTAAQSGSFVPPNFCLVANPGNVAADPVVSAWDYLMTLDSIAVPVFDPSYNTIATNNVAACRAGNNGCYPVQAIASVKVCAYRWQGKTPAAVSTSPLCAGLSLSTVRDGPNQDALYLALTGPVQLSGSYGPAPGSVGDGSNVLGTRLVQ